MYARLSFWYGLGFAEIGAMPQAAIAAYLERLPGLQTELKALVYEAIAVTQMERSARRRVINGWQRVLTGRRVVAPVSRAVLQM
ncbi:hypothetical protein D6833_08340, partial [Candidatus Parcubacteria bacterium]